MQLKRLRHAAATGTCPEALHNAQEVTASQLLRKLEDPAPNKDAAADPALDAAAAVAAFCTNGSHTTPLSGTTRERKVNTGLSSSAKRQRREFKSLFGEQELGIEQQGANLSNGIVQQGQEDADDVDLVTPPWLQQTTPPASAAPKHQNSSVTTAAAVAGANLLSGGRDCACDANNANAAAAEAEALGQDSGWRLSKGAGCTPAAQQHAQQRSVHTPRSAPSSGHKQQQQQRQHEGMTQFMQQQQGLQKQLHQAPLCSRPRGSDVMQRQGQQQAQQNVTKEEEDAICDDSDYEDERCNHAPGSAAAADLQHLAPRGVQHPAALLTSPRSDSKVLRQRQQRQQGRSSTVTQGAPADQNTSLNIGGHGLQWAECEQHWQQQDASFVASTQLPEPPKMETGLAAAAAGSSIFGSRAPVQDDDDAAMWEPPKNRRQQQQPPQIPVTVSRPPAAPRMQQASMGGYAAVATDAGHVGGYSAGAGAADSWGVGAAAVGARAGGGVSSAAEAPPWWTVLEDFVPVEVLVQSLVNPRDNSIVHINYKSQFKDGGAAGKRASAAGTATNSSRKKGTGSTRGRKGAAAAAKKATAGTAFTTAGANFLASLQGGRKGSRKGSSGGRKGSRKSGSGRSRGSGSGRGSGGASGGQKKQGRRRTGRWTFINGHKVFIDHSGKQLTGSAAYMQWKASKG